ncbi:streptomycin 6-kinase [Streptomyces sp. Ag109_O5-1]|uniref:aminoglycoside phosphotransferase family protein n=1 Tax=Streptomyces sp. Ag109_O5-1 TaxID=1938851 RepID=UPI000F4D8CC8|nr:aminoglycoside phosphotransferase family protein [Streptomyces sp. Ag109_O5-1]RPE44099.1 streptomycin 6-kinase [Streptomyces sp. Ag109_O5-1]
MIGIPEELARGTIGREGDRGAAWIAELPSIVQDLLDEWDCAPDGEVTHGGVGVIVPVRQRSSRRPCVLKVSFPHPGNVHEPDAFEAWAGRGAVLLHRRDDARYALLLERAHMATLASLEPDEETVVAIAGRLNHRLAVPAPPGLPRLRDQADAWAAELRKDAVELPHPLPPRAVDAAVATARELGRSQPDTLVHGDLHARNILRADREPWLAVDPKGYVGDPAYDGGTLLKSRALTLMGAGDLARTTHRLLDIFAETAQLDRERVRRWAQFHVARASFWGRRHAFRVARGGPELDRITEFADELAELLVV